MSVVPLMKTCISCERTLPLNQFDCRGRSPQTGWSFGKKRRCRSCAGRGHEIIRQRAAAATTTRFWSKVDQSGGPDSCWLWVAGLRDDGYGQFNATPAEGPRYSIAAHRFAWILTNGPIPDGVCVCHDCPNGDDPRCCNPAHLFLGTVADNNADMRTKGRQGGTFLPGERHRNARFTRDQARAIRGAVKSGDVSVDEMAARHGVHPVTIYSLVRGATYRD